MSRSLLARLTGVVIACSIGAVSQAATPQTIHLTVSGVEREYILLAPDRGSATARPLVLLLHGHLGTAANALGDGLRPSPLSAWRAIAEREPVLVAALQGLTGADHRTGWHDCRDDALENPQVDDLAFADAVAQTLIRSGRADAHRLYAMGMSNGAMMALRLALQMQPRPAAVAAVSGAMAAHSSCGTPQRTVSVLLINGTDDPLVPFSGGVVGLRHHKGGEVIGFEAGRDLWLRADGLSTTAAVSSSFPQQPASGATRATRTVYGSDSGPQVETIVVEHGGHVEPSLQYHYGWMYSRLVGAQNRDFESAEEAWSFFRNKTSP
jgi:polyhydroxybutyrate depolymerase